MTMRQARSTPLEFTALLPLSIRLVSKTYMEAQGAAPYPEGTEPS